MTAYQLNLPPHTTSSAPEAARPMLQRAADQLGFVPNMYARMANLPGLLGSYLHGYEAFRAQSGLTPAEQEIVLLVISRANGCEYCVAAHSMIGTRMTGVPAVALEAIRGGLPLEDQRLQALVRFTTRMLETRGRPLQADAAAFLEAGFTEQQILGVILAIGVKTLSNYTNHVFHTPLDPAMATFAWTES